MYKSNGGNLQKYARGNRAAMQHDMQNGRDIIQLMDYRREAAGVVSDGLPDGTLENFGYLKLVHKSSAFPDSALHRSRQSWTSAWDRPALELISASFLTARHADAH